MTPQIPYGMRDWLPAEARRKRRLENQLIELFAARGFAEIDTPALEYADTLSMGSGDQRSIEKHLFKLFDRRNHTLALRHEMTTPIARLVAARLRDAPLPLKLAYAAPVYRYELAQTGRRCEFHQAGVELIGASQPDSDVLVIALALDALRAAALPDFRLCLSHTEYIHGLLEARPLENLADLRHALEHGDLVALQRFGDPWSQLPLLQGGAEVLDAADRLAPNPRSRAAVGHLRAIVKQMHPRRLDDHLLFDFSLIRDFAYYTGVVFEAYTPRLGAPVLGGGRYDHLLAQFGFDQPAIGFALGLERALLAAGMP